MNHSYEIQPTWSTSHFSNRLQGKQVPVLDGRSDCQGVIHDGGHQGLRWSSAVDDRLDRLGRRLCFLVAFRSLSIYATHQQILLIFFLLRILRTRTRDTLQPQRVWLDMSTGICDRSLNIHESSRCFDCCPRVSLTHLSSLRSFFFLYLSSIFGLGRRTCAS